MKPCAARLTFTQYLFCLEFGQAAKPERAAGAAPGKQSEEFIFSPELTVVFGPDFAPALRWVLLDGVTALKAIGRVELPRHFNVDPDRNPFIYPAEMTASRQQESYAHTVLEGTALPDATLGFALRSKEDQRVMARPAVGLTVIDMAACVFDEGQVTLELGFSGGKGNPAGILQVALTPVLTWQTTSLVSDMAYAYQAQYGGLRIGSMPPSLPPDEAPRLRRTVYAPGSIARQLGPPKAA